ncbi:MAG: hypothetical protein AYK22_04790 [Thermoplasmatales archaeon SG8-52-3]|nr:MAG: hypothetical protein AYK22_04790 [Thermoplasmatales archaeon SG8-52-3]
MVLNPFLGSLSINPLELFETKTQRHIQVWERIENFISLMKQMFIIGEIQEARLRQSLATLYTGTNTPNRKEDENAYDETGQIHEGLLRPDVQPQEIHALFLAAQKNERNN